MTTEPSLSRREFLAATAVVGLHSTASAADPESIIGPLVGHVDSSKAMLWARMPRAGQYMLKVRSQDGGKSQSILAEASEDSDLTVKWTASGLAPATPYAVELEGGGPCSFTTPPRSDQPSRVTIAIGSCALEDAGTRSIWTRMLAENPDAVFLAGDTPYIDSTDLAKQRSRHRTFAAVPEYQKLLSTRPFWSTWDDHDFGKNDADGTLKGKENSRRAFMEYRAQPEYGDGEGGIYTSFRWGPVEFFLIDARWWSWTGPSFADPSKKTLLGQTQWAWLRQKLLASTAPFKVLAVGLVWEDKKNREKDHWETYLHERDALFAFIKENRIPGVVLFGGDIHVTRLLRYPPEFVGYPLYDFISSPMHANVIPSLNVKHPYLIESAVQPNTFMTLTADTTKTPATLTARFLDKDGQPLFADITIGADDLKSPG